MTHHRGFRSMPGAGLPGVGLALVVALATATGAGAGEVSPWVASLHAKARLIAAGPAGTGSDGAPPALLAGIEIALAPHFITYWRDPGDAGVPPSFDLAGSTNLASARILYPAPAKIEEAGATAYGYRDDVVFPVLVTPADAGRPVRLHLKLDYAACHDICLPARAELALSLDATPSADGTRVREALATVPRPLRVGEAAGGIGIVAVRPERDGLTVEARGADRGTLLVEAPVGWAYAAGPGVPGEAGLTVFPVKRLDQPKGETVPAAPLVLTLVAPGGAIEVPVQLDAAAPTP